jgi:hypothetical protein
MGALRLLFIFRTRFIGWRVNHQPRREISRPPRRYFSSYALQLLWKAITGGQFGSRGKATTEWCKCAAMKNVLVVQVQPTMHGSFVLM